MVTPTLHWPDRGETDWEEKYRTGDMPWEKGAPAPGLEDFLLARPELPRGTVLVPGCGTGHDVRVWAHHGFHATGLDIAPSAVRLARERTPAGMTAEFRPGNFLTDEPFALFDWIWEHTCFCAINPARREEYVRAVQRWLKPDGQYLAVNYLIEDQEGPPFGTTREEILARFAPHFALVQDWVPRSYPNRTGRERMFWWRRK
jgi:cyclopropane fatty-acyl-phospholipid synthase-like methyltransferase